MINLFKIVNNIYNIKGIFHIGAHHGEEVYLYRELNLPSILFEPHPESYKILTSKFQNANDVILANLALGPKNTTKTLYCETVNQGMSSSLLEPEKHLKYYPHIVFDSEIQVNQISLDEYVSSKNIDLNVYNFITMDVQGYELEVLKGSIETLKSIDHILTEINYDDLYKNCVKVDELDQFLSQYGFTRLLTEPTNWFWGNAFYSKV